MACPQRGGRQGSIPRDHYVPRKQLQRCWGSMSTELPRERPPPQPPTWTSCFAAGRRDRSHPGIALPTQLAADLALSVCWQPFPAGTFVRLEFKLQQTSCRKKDWKKAECKVKPNGVSEDMLCPYVFVCERDGEHGASIYNWAFVGDSEAGSPEMGAAFLEAEVAQSGPGCDSYGWAEVCPGRTAEGWATLRTRVLQRGSCFRLSSCLRLQVTGGNSPWYGVCLAPTPGLVNSLCSVSF